MKLLNKTNLTTSLCLLGLSIFNSQQLMASSSYLSSAQVQYTITASNRNLSGNLSSLDISDLFDAYPDDSDTQSLTSLFTPIHNPYSGLNIAHSNQLTTQDTINNGSATSEYFADFELNFKNLSADITDIFDITISYTLSLSTQANGEHADTDITTNIYNRNDDWLGGIDLTASTNTQGTDTDFFSDILNITLEKGQVETIYIETFVSSSLEATGVAPVPVPAAFWMFSSALLAFPGIKKLRKA